MKLVQLFIPLYDTSGNRFPVKYYDDLQKQLTEKFGGLTIYKRGPTTGLWKEDRKNMVKDELIIFEVMTEEVNNAYWQKFKQSLTKQFLQKELLIRSSIIDLI